MTTEQTPLRHPSIEAWVAADRQLDLASMAEQLSEDVELVSPLTDAFVFRGRRDVIEVFAAAFDILTEIEIEGVTGAGDHWVIHGTNRLGRRNLEEIQWLTVGEDGLISHVRLFVRPLPSAMALLARIGPRLHARGVMPRRAEVAARSAAPLVVALDAVERFVMPRVGPRRR